MYRTLMAVFATRQKLFITVLVISFLKFSEIYAWAGRVARLEKLNE